MTTLPKASYVETSHERSDASLTFASRWSPNVWLAIGMVLTVLSGMRWGVSALAWLAPVPFLVYIRCTAGWPSRLLLLLALQVAINLQVLKMITEPLPVVVAFAFGVPMAFGAWLVFLLWNALRLRVGDAIALYLFPALIAVSEWVSYAYTDFGVWGAGANTQLNNLALLQLASLVGVTGVGFLMAWMAALVAQLLCSETPRLWLRHGLALASVLALALCWGSVRLFATQAGPSALVAGVVSDIGMQEALTEPEKLSKATGALFTRTELAAERGAELVVWNEGATLVAPAEEAAFVERAQALTTETGIDLVLAYVVPTRTDPIHHENKYRWLTPGGELETYFKHHPVPGEPTTRGTEAVVAHERPFGRAAGAICYDYDFPTLARQHAQAGAGLVVVPASDWRGIDPYHTEMTRLRAIEGGFSVVRPVRWATSAAYDAYGRNRGTLSWFEDNDRIFMTQVPTTQIATLYTSIGDVFPALCAAFAAACAGLALSSRRWVTSPAT